VVKALGHAAQAARQAQLRRQLQQSEDEQQLIRFITVNMQVRATHSAE
jgi:hypothetical protein